MQGNFLEYSTSGEGRFFRPYWKYYLSGTLEEKQSILSYSHGFYGVHKSHDNYFITLGRFHGPFITVGASDGIEGNAPIIKCADVLPDFFAQDFFSTNNWELSILEKLEVIINAFIDLPTMAEAIDIVFDCKINHESNVTPRPIKVNLKKIILLILNKISGEHIGEYKEFNIDGGEENHLQFLFKTSFYKINLSNTLVPYKKTSVAISTVFEGDIDFSIEGLYIPVALEYYLLYEFKYYLLEQSSQDEDVVAEYENDEYISNRDEWVRNELDDMSDVDPGWHWNID